MKMAVIFPGIGYRFERPLLKAGMDAAKENGYEILLVDYGGFGDDAKQNLNQAVDNAVNQAEKILSNVKWESYEKILFIGKSIGTAVATIYSAGHKINCKKILLTPIPQTFSVKIEKAIAFYGKSDPWITEKQVTDGCEKNSIPLSVYENANHSLVTGNEVEDRLILSDVMKKINALIRAAHNTATD